jgi:predicted unusual protein kinase regulating ubiquinone biosynthesis (AarF/ABC1/UbiB family)
MCSAIRLVCLIAGSSTTNSSLSIAAPTDPHAGNLLACPDGRLCYLDFGMMSYADTQQRNGFLLAVVHIVNRDWNELVLLYQKLGFIPEGTDLKPIQIALEKALPDVLNADISELNFKNVVNKLGDIMYTYPFSLPPFYIAIIRCLGVLEGLAIQVSKSYAQSNIRGSSTS